ncbi:hypothetical protein SAMN04488103_1067 [Gemmobacter aquatilis]|uniref:Uncharacterized protein n=1 Tax=Gemmobacter aquatilis TaxID=933059 RepID=A0A1H8HPT7_9RHOB|nr:hypothetical protein [Gemmobacter aquatilis]SEN58034.1 hypothetical protein SAMN04488103_1067 [Gemmobacter aquatilis]
MTLKTLAEIAAGFARIDGISDEDHPAFDKFLRNLTQRHFLPPTEQVGRAFLYDPAAAVTIRLAQIAAEFGLPRTTIDALARWLSGSGERKKRISDSMLKGVTYAEEALDRVTAGETFAVHVIMCVDRSVIVKPDWDHPRSEHAENALRLIGKGPKAEIARFSLPASALIAEILPFLKG